MRKFAPSAKRKPSEFCRVRGPIAPQRKPHDHKWCSANWPTMANDQREPRQHRVPSHREIIKRGFNRIEAAAYIGISPGKFDQLVADGRMPKAKKIDGRKVWD